MAKIPGPMDVPYASVGNTRRVVQVTPDNSGERLHAVGSAVERVLTHARDQQIENDVVNAELTTRRELDQLTAKFENDPDHATYAQRYGEAARAVVERNSERLTSPMHQRLWRARAEGLVQAGEQQVTQLAQRRTVEAARAGLLETIGTAQATLVDENATPELRAEAMTLLETSIHRAVERRTIAADAGQQMINSARADVAEFERTLGLRQQAQTEEDRIWAESGGDLGVALEMSRELSGSIRDSVEDRIATRYSRTQAAERESLDDAMGRAFTLIEQGGSLDSLSAADRDVVTRAGQMDTLRAYTRSRAGGGEGVEASNRRSRDITDSLLAASDEDENAAAFAGLDLYAPLNADAAGALGLQEGRSVAEQVRPGDFRELRRRQRQMNGEEPLTENQTISQRAYGLIRNYAEPQARAQGIGISDREEDVETTRRFRGFLNREARDFVETNRRLPNDREIREITSLALLQSSRSNHRAFEARSTTGRNLFGRTENSFAVRVPYSRIPAYQRDRLARAWVRAGRPGEPTEADIEQMYVLEMQSGAQ